VPEQSVPEQSIPKQSIPKQVHSKTVHPEVTGPDPEDPGLSTSSINGIRKTFFKSSLDLRRRSMTGRTGFTPFRVTSSRLGKRVKADPSITCTVNKRHLKSSLMEETRENSHLKQSGAERAPSNDNSHWLRRNVPTAQCENYPCSDPPPFPP